MMDLPEALAPMGAYLQFVPFRLVPSKTRPGKTDKTAVDYRSGWKHDPTDPAIHLTFEAASNYVATGAADGVGFVFTNNDPFWFLDIDGAYDGTAWSATATALLQWFPGAAVEVSSSGTGLHVFGTGTPPEHACKNTALGIEFYHTGRFAALTGTHARGSAAFDASHLMPAFVAEYFTKEAVELNGAMGWGGGPSEDWDGHTDDAELIQHALSAKSSASVFGGRASFADLWAGNAEALAKAYPDGAGEQGREYDASSADAAIAQHLAFWTGRDCDRVLSLMWQSALVRDKWERDDYLVRTIEGAVARCKNVHQRPQVSGRTFDEMLKTARAMDSETHPDEIEALAIEAGALKPLQLRAVAEACKKATGTPLSTFKQAAKGDESKEDAPDHLQLAWAIVQAVGVDNVLGAGPFVYQWNNVGLWVQQDDRTIKQQVQRIISDQVTAVNKNLVDGVADVLKTEVYKPNHIFNIGPVESVNCLNGELILEGHAWRLSPHIRGHYRTTQIPVKYDLLATCKRFVQFLNEVFAGDEDAEDKKRALLEMIGYSLMAHCQHEKFVILVGGGANGKSVLLAILEALLGIENVAGVQPSQFDRSFQRAHLHNKLANIVTEVKQGEVIDDASLKGIVSGETTTVERKFKDPFNMNPFATCWLGTNHMPHTRDFSDGLFRRALVIEFNNVFKPELGNCDPQLKPKLTAELPGILTMALAAYGRAVVNGFTLPASCESARNAWRMEADQVAQFVEDACQIGPAHCAQMQPLFDAYIVWARSSGIHKTLGVRNFVARLEKLGITREKRRAGMFAVGVAPSLFNGRA